MITLLKDSTLFTAVGGKTTQTKGWSETCHSKWSTSHFYKHYEVLLNVLLFSDTPVWLLEAECGETYAAQTLTLRRSCSDTSIKTEFIANDPENPSSGSSSFNVKICCWTLSFLTVNSESLGVLERRSDRRRHEVVTLGFRRFWWARFTMCDIDWNHEHKEILEKDGWMFNLTPGQTPFYILDC